MRRPGIGESASLLVGQCERPHMTDLWSLVHLEFGPMQTFLTREEAARELEDVLRDEPGWADKLSIEPFSFR